MRALTVAAAVLVAACAPHQPGTGVDRDIAKRYLCDADSVRAEARKLKAELEGGHYYIPQVGWSACDLLAHNGEPDRVERQQTRRSLSLSWWYETDTDVKLVTLELDNPGGEPGWYVTYVGW